MATASPLSSSWERRGLDPETEVVVFTLGKYGARSPKRTFSVI